MSKGKPAAARNQAASNVVPLFPASEGEGFDNPYEFDAHFRVWVSWQNRLAVEAELPYEDLDDLARRYVRLMDAKRAAQPGAVLGGSMLQDMKEAFA